MTVDRLTEQNFSQVVEEIVEEYDTLNYSDEDRSGTLDQRVMNDENELYVSSIESFWNDWEFPSRLSATSEL